MVVLNTPIYKTLGVFLDDDGYKKLILSELGDSTLIADYICFEFPDDSYYGDVEHLNKKGAEYFSSYIAKNGVSFQYLVDYCKH